MIFNSDDLEQVKYIPAKMQRYMVEAIKNGDSDFTIEDPTNPFTMLLEANTISTLSALEEMSSAARMLFPSLAKTKDELYHHISQEEEKYIFGSPAKTKITMMINLKDIISLGVYDSQNDKYLVTLPKYTEITVSDHTLTIMNDINIYLQNNQVFVEEIRNDIIDISENSLGNIYSVITTDTKGVEWVIFEISVLQLERSYYEFSVLKNNAFEQVIPIDNNYYYSKVFIQDNNGEFVDLNITHSPIIYDHTVPTISVTVMDNAVKYKIPDFYTIDGQISGIIRIEIYTTKGKVLLPLNKFSPEDFKIKLPKHVFTNESAAMVKINKIAFSNNILDGGVSSRKTRDIRNKIIFNTTGTLDLPITEKQLREDSRNNGFVLYKAIDTITDRIFIATKNINDVYKVNDLPSNIDVYNNTLKLLVNYVDSNNVIIDNDMVLIKSNTIFKANNGNVEVVNDVDINSILNSALQNKIDLMYNNEYFFTPFYYIMDLDKDVIASRIYDMDNPTVSYLTILNKNPYLEENVNIKKYGIIKTDNGYELYFSLYGNDKFNAIPKQNVFIQLGLKINDYNQKIYFIASYDQVLDKYVAKIDTNFLIDKTDRLTILNGQSNISINKLFIDNEIEYIIYTNTNTIQRDDRYEPTLDLIDQSSNVNALCLQNSKVTFGINLKYLYNKVNTVYTERKYKKAMNDIPLRYKDDVFSTDIVDNNGYVIDTDYTNIDNIKFLHKKNDIVLDSNGEVIYEYKIGDILKDENGNPIIDEYDGIIRYMDILMLPYEYKIVDNILYNNYINDIVSLIIKWTNEDMYYLNSKLLEHTIIYYKPSKSITSVILENNTAITHIISPTVTLYVDKTIYDIDTTYTDLKSRIGKILHKYIEKKVIVLSDISKEIMYTISNAILSVKITGIDSTDAEILSLKDTSNRLTIKKVISRDNEVLYDLDLKIIKI